MDHAQTDQLVQQLAAGFDTLQEEYQKLFGQQQALERKLATAREQVRSEHALHFELYRMISMMKHSFSSRPVAACGVDGDFSN